MSLQQQIDELLDSLNAKTSTYARHLATGAEIAVRADEPADALSVIKIPVLVQAFRDVEAGLLNLDERTAIGPQDRRNGTGVLKNFTPGLMPTYRDLLTQMIITSDNTATDLVIDKVGFDRVNELMGKLGYHQTRMQHTLADYFRRRWELVDATNASLSNAEVFDQGFPRDGDAHQRDFVFEGNRHEWLGSTTAREMTGLLTQIQNAELVSRSYSDQMVNILKRQTYHSRLPRFIGDRVAIGHKTGDWGPFAGNDVGILYPDSGPIVVSVFAFQNRSDFEEVEVTHGRIAELLIQSWG